MSSVSILGSPVPTNIPAATIYHPIAGPTTDHPISFPVGTPVAPDPSALPESPGMAVPAVATSAGTTFAAVGLAATPGVVGKHFQVQTQGPLELTTDEWDALTGDTGGLSNSTLYYLAGAPGNGKIAPGPPGAGNQTVLLGVGLSPTTMLVMVSRAL